MKTIQRLTLCALFALCSLYANAYSFELDGIYYNFVTGKYQVKVTFKDTNYNSYSGDIVIPSEVDYNGSTYEVVTIEGSAFYNCTELYSIVIPGSVTTVSADAFGGCTSLTTVIMEDGTETLELYVNGYNPITQFNDCPIETLYLGRDLYYNSYYIPFQKKRTIKSLTIGDFVTNINDNAFYNCSGLTYIDFGNGLKAIGEGAFTSCTGLTSIELPNSLSTIGKLAFSGCTYLEKITLGSGVNLIENMAFNLCLRTTEINSKNPEPPTIADGTVLGMDKNSCILYVPSGCKDVYSSASYWEDFYNIEEKDFTLSFAVGELTYSESGAGAIVTGLSDTSYSGEISIPKTVVYEGVTYLVISVKESAFEGTNISGVTIPNTVTELGDKAFANCSNLKTVTIEDGEDELAIGYSYKDIGGDYSTSFNDTPVETLYMGRTLTYNCIWTPSLSPFRENQVLSSVIIGEQVTSMPLSLFYGCTGLVEITSLNPEPPRCKDENVFVGVPTSTCVLTVPLGSKEAYSTAYDWEAFTNIVEMDLSGIESVSTDNAEVSGYYTIDGKAVNAPQRGVNIVKYSDGTTKKILVK